MPRPKLKRKVCCKLKSNYFKPQGIPLRNLEEIILNTEEIEALRLKNIKNLDQIKAAQKMQTSQSTFQRILSSAYQKISTALIKGQAIRIEKRPDQS